MRVYDSAPKKAYRLCEVEMEGGRVICKEIGMFLNKSKAVHAYCEYKGDADLFLFGPSGEQLEPNEPIAYPSHQSQF